MDTTRPDLNTIREDLLYGKEARPRSPLFDRALAALTSMDAAPQGLVEAGDDLRRFVSDSSFQPFGKRDPVIQGYLDAWDAAKSRTTPAVALRSGGYDELLKHLQNGGEAFATLIPYGNHKGTYRLRRVTEHEVYCDRGIGSYHRIYHRTEGEWTSECTRLGLQFVLIQPEQK